ncbi:hypothetical protein FSP39_000283 [Pinctada imbricata]|uniref:Uncharacterized protein n=1 Tax=Pinctada imbricata TaxID=66713 RepID=A0AA89C3W9_PINIB|nr:hypothetical protein FSP39_000283 [Pinctada imbricata]
MSRFLNLHIPSKSSFHRMQTTYLVPAIDAMSENEEEEAGQEKTCKDLQQWNQDIVNHFWHCCKTANTYEEFLVCWNSCFCTTLYISVDTYLF